MAETQNIVCIVLFTRSEAPFHREKDGRGRMLRLRGMRNSQDANPSKPPLTKNDENDENAGQGGRRSTRHKVKRLPLGTLPGPNAASNDKSTLKSKKRPLEDYNKGPTSRKRVDHDILTDEDGTMVSLFSTGRGTSLRVSAAKTKSYEALLSSDALDTGPVQPAPIAATPALGVEVTGSTSPRPTALPPPSVMVSLFQTARGTQVNVSSAKVREYAAKLQESPVREEDHGVQATVDSRTVPGTISLLDKASASTFDSRQPERSAQGTMSRTSPHDQDSTVSMFQSAKRGRPLHVSAAKAAMYAQTLFATDSNVHQIDPSSSRLVSACQVDPVAILADKAYERQLCSHDKELQQLPVIPPLKNKVEALSTPQLSMSQQHGQDSDRVPHDDDSKLRNHRQATAHATELAESVHGPFSVVSLFTSGRGRPVEICVDKMQAYERHLFADDDDEPAPPTNEEVEACSNTPSSNVTTVKYDSRLANNFKHHDQGSIMHTTRREDDNKSPVTAFVQHVTTLNSDLTNVHSADKGDACKEPKINSDPGRALAPPRLPVVAAASAVPFPVSISESWKFPQLAKCPRAFSPYPFESATTIHAISAENAHTVRFNHVGRPELLHCADDGMTWSAGDLYEYMVAQRHMVPSLGASRCGSSAAYLLQSLPLRSLKQDGGLVRSIRCVVLRVSEMLVLQPKDSTQGRHPRVIPDKFLHHMLSSSSSDPLLTNHTTASTTSAPTPFLRLRVACSHGAWAVPTENTTQKRLRSSTTTTAILTLWRPSEEMMQIACKEGAEIFVTSVAVSWTHDQLGLTSSKHTTIQRIESKTEKTAQAFVGYEPRSALTALDMKNKCGKDVDTCVYLVHVTDDYAFATDPSWAILCVKLPRWGAKAWKNGTLVCLRNVFVSHYDAHLDVLDCVMTDTATVSTSPPLPSSYFWAPFLALKEFFICDSATSTRVTALRRRICTSILNHDPPPSTSPIHVDDNDNVPINKKEGQVALPSTDMESRQVTGHAMHVYTLPTPIQDPVHGLLSAVLYVDTGAHVHEMLVPAHMTTQVTSAVACRQLVHVRVHLGNIDDDMINSCRSWEALEPFRARRVVAVNVQRVSPSSHIQVLLQRLGTNP
ncbi:hypothetical protein DYB35_005479 [Aphanomyces astaci]|uniref:BRCA2 OB1 domain-containing protein n=1 Tax=Aphanomyces astaci TaxID=112090 RepID=A0A3R7AVL9_APHAT|nr:hypothetical protein DYB35_005479 [Aphanomyces astaci]